MTFSENDPSVPRMTLAGFFTLLLPDNLDLFAIKYLLALASIYRRLTRNHSQKWSKPSTLFYMLISNLLLWSHGHSFLPYNHDTSISLTINEKVFKIYICALFYSVLISDWMSSVKVMTIALILPISDTSLKSCHPSAPSAKINSSWMHRAMGILETRR